MANLSYWNGSTWVQIGTGGPQGPAGVDGPAGPDGESVTVFEQAAVPSALRTGDLWLEPVAGAVVGRDGLTIEEVEAVVAGQLSKLPPAATLDEAALKSAISAAESAKRDPTPWYALGEAPSIGTTMSVFACVINGVMYLRGKISSSFGVLPTGRFGDIPPILLPPAIEQSVMARGVVQGTGAAAVAFVTIRPNGWVFLNAPNCSEVVFDGISFPVK